MEVGSGGRLSIEESADESLEENLAILLSNVSFGACKVVRTSRRQYLNRHLARSRSRYYQAAQVDNYYVSQPRPTANHRDRGHIQRPSTLLRTVSAS
jgi:hypothetical protein